MTFPLLRPAYYRSLFAALWQFLVNPHYPEDPDSGSASTREKVRDTFGLFLIKLLLFVLIAVFMALISPVFDPENISVDSVTERFSPIGLLFVAGLALPLLEEIGFRLSLKFRPEFLSMSVAVMSYYVLTKLVFETSNSVVDESFVTRTFASLLFGLALYPVFRIARISGAMLRFWRRHFRWIFYTSCALFAFVHLFNYQLTLINILLMPLITLPQIVSGVIYGYARVVLGFQYALLAHSINNSIFVLASLLPDSDLF